MTIEAHLLVNQAKLSFESGQYRQSLDLLTQALDRGGLSVEGKGDAKLWQIMAHQALGENQEALALCQQLTSFPSYVVRKEAKRLLGILQAPQLRRPQTWVTPVPTFEGDRESTKVYTSAGVKTTSKTPEDDNPYLHPKEIPEDATLDNSFLGVAIAATLILFGCFLVWG